MFWAIFIPAAILIIAAELTVLIVNSSHMAREKFVCRFCRKSFYTKWYKLMFQERKAFDQAYLKCPHCLKKGICDKDVHHKNES
ncbi:MAG: hypothetical protein IJR55_06685 [Clostridia bacterium]|nr:hypothetical protein [Clostridia bacterium]